MSPTHLWRSLPVLARVAMAQAFTYRGDVVVGTVGAIIFPIVMCAVCTATMPGGSDASSRFGAYFLATFAVQQVIGSDALRDVTQDVREGTLVSRLLRPLHPLIAYGVENAAFMPMRAVMALPAFGAFLYLVSTSARFTDAGSWALAAVAVVGGWLIGLLTSLFFGCLAFYIDSNVAVAGAYMAVYLVMSGYSVPIELFPAQLQALSDYLPFRYQLALPVELLTGRYDSARDFALVMVGRQWLVVAALLALLLLTWRQGARRFSAFGG